MGVTVIVAFQTLIAKFKILCLVVNVKRFALKASVLLVWLKQFLQQNGTAMILILAISMDVTVNADIGIPTVSFNQTLLSAVQVTTDALTTDVFQTSRYAIRRFMVHCMGAIVVVGLMIRIVFLKTLFSVAL